MKAVAIVVVSERSIAIELQSETVREISLQGLDQVFVLLVMQSTQLRASAFESQLSDPSSEETPLFLSIVRSSFEHQMELQCRQVNHSMNHVSTVSAGAFDTYL